MATYQLRNSAYWDDGFGVVGKDVDGQLVPGYFDYAGPDEPSHFSRSRKVVYNFPRSSAYWNGVTVGKDHDGILVLDYDVTDPTVFGITMPREPVLTRLMRDTLVYSDGAGGFDKEANGYPIIGSLDEGEEDTPRPNPKVSPRSFKSPYWVDPNDPGRTLLKDTDGILIIGPDHIADFKECPGTFTLDQRVGAAAKVSGTSSATGSAQLRKLISAIIQGTSIATASPRLRFTLAEAISGTSSATAEAKRIAVTTANAAIVFGAVANSFLAITAPLPSVSRSFSERLDELRPLEGYEVGFRSNPAVNNRVELLGSANFQLVSSYTGPAYTLGGPADPGASPVQLGLKRGDKIRLIGQVGGEPNDGKEYTFFDPSTWAILESAVTPDTNEYDFIILRRIS